ncbi:hypothetical protein [Pedobacter sp. SYSU D00535]|uniref:hypothetical protein n=1 Tax=Pedobacter sp. SYSU D00535 TaxID=2810308 RepID=UPI001A961EF1|nr:hypothetical protein [Pedobacter sp. SYSU D00535]
MKKIFMYYRVYQNGTAVSPMSANDFKSNVIAARDGKPSSYHLPFGDSMFYEYPGLIVAMEMAKAGALSYINLLLKEGAKGLERLKQYRVDNYENLNIVLVESNIRKLETAMLLNKS